MDAYILEMKNIKKMFAGIVALNQVSLQVKPGEIHGLLGENGAGKSTLMKILLGVHRPDQGDIFIKGEKVDIRTPKDALNYHVAMIYQELNPIPHLSVAENIYLGREPIHPRSRMVDFRTMYQKAQELFQKIGIDIDVRKPAKSLSVAKLQLMEIAKAISYEADIIIMDEPTSALSETEIQKLMEVVLGLKAQGISIIYISHKLEEVYRLCDRVTVLRDGNFIGSEETKTLETSRLIAMMVGREVTQIFPEKTPHFGEVILEVKDVSSHPLLHNISFQLCRGEVLGLSGLMGAGRTELAEVIFGVRPMDSGRIYVQGKPVKINHPQEAIRQKIAMVPEDRKNTGLVLKLPIGENLIMMKLEKCLGKVFLRRKKEQACITAALKTFQIKAANPKLPVASLSGGNQQKVVISKCLFSDPDIIILDEPTRGIDVKTKAEIYRLINQLAAEGKAVLVISSEIPEILGLCDRIIVLHEGKSMGELKREQATPEKILAMAFAEGVGV